MSEAQEAVNQLFASCEDSDTWASYSCSSADSAPAPVAPVAPRSAPKTRTLCGYADRRKRPALAFPPLGAPLGTLGMAPADLGPRMRLGTMEPGVDHVDEEVIILKEMRDARLEAELEEDAELSSELEKFRMLASGAERPAGTGTTTAGSTYREGDDYWRGTPDPEDIFTQLNF